MRRSEGSGEFDAHILREAAEWLVVIQSGDLNEERKLGLSQWRRSSPAHEAAWRRAESMLRSLEQLPTELARETLKRSSNISRRRLLAIGAIGILAPTTWLGRRHTPWPGLTADLRTRTGEQRRVELVDGTVLTLNTDSAVDLTFTKDARSITLIRGEVLVATGIGTKIAARALVVRTPHGTISPIGTRFSVRQFDAFTRVTVTNGAVDIRTTSGRAMFVHAGQRREFSATLIHPQQSAEANAVLWEKGMFVAKDLPLDKLIAELARYHRGYLRCEPSVAPLRVSGAFPIRDVPSALRLLQQTLPIRISESTSYWITIQAR